MNVSLFRRQHRDLIAMLYPGRLPEYSLLLESLGEYLEKEILPTARRIDEERTFPRENLDKLFKQGLTAMAFPVAQGGLELPYPVYVAAMEMVAMCCASTAISISIHGTTCSGIDSFGDDRQKEVYLKPMVAGLKLGAFALTEPHSGSDAGAVETKAQAKGGEYLLNGSKIFISNGGVADIYFVFASTEKGPSAFIVENGTKGLKFGRNMAKMGIRGSTLTEVFFEDCEVPRENLVGREGEGFNYAKEMLNGGRVTIAALSVGIAQEAFEKSLAYSRERVTFGKPIARHQMIRQKLADMSTAIGAARQLTYYAAWAKQSGADYGVLAAQAKLFASETALKVCDDAIQIHGGYGYTDGFDVHRHWRDARLMTIGEGTSEIMKLVISKGLVREG